MHSKSDNIELMPYDIANMVVNELFESLLSSHQISLETSMRERSYFRFSPAVVL